jgi:general secretion pathway protein D
VTQEVSDVVPTTSSSINSPTIEQRKFSSVVAVRDGQTIALGGLITDSKTRTSTGIPFLRDIPVLGNLFGSDVHNTTRTELIVLITPHVIRTSDESDDAMEELRGEFPSLHNLVPQWQAAEGNGTQKLPKQKNTQSAISDGDAPAKP